MHARFPPKKSPWKTQNLNKKKIYTENIIFEYTENLKKKISSNIKNRHEKK